MLLWQIAAVAHLASARHSYCLLHQTVEHADLSDGHHRHHQHGSDGPFSNHSDHDCFVVVALATCTATPLSCGVCAEPPEQVIELLESTVQRGIVASHRELFRLAPSLSPPNICVLS